MGSTALWVIALYSISLYMVCVLYYPQVQELIIGRDILLQLIMEDENVIEKNQHHTSVYQWASESPSAKRVR